MRLKLLLLFLISIYLASCSKNTDGLKPQLTDITESVYSTVAVKPQQLYTVYASISGIVEYTNLEEGKSVEVNEILLKIKNQQSEISTTNAKLNYEIVKQNYEGDATVLQEIEEKINTVKIKLEVDSLNYVRQERLLNQNIGSLQNLESKKLNFGVTKNELNSLLNQYRRTQGELKRKVEQARNTYKLNNINQQEYFVKSKMDGRVYEVFKERGESITPQSPIAHIGSKDSFIIELLIDEVDITKIFEGQFLQVALDAYPQQTFKAKVERIYPTKDEITHTFVTEAQFVDVPPRLFNGLSGEANIIISKRSQVLTIPTEYINEKREVMTADGPVRVEVGMQNIEFTEIVSGLDTSTIVLSEK